MEYDSEGYQKLWIVRWRKSSGTGHIYNTQGTNFRIFSNLVRAKEFSEELHRRVKLRHQADTGDMAHPSFYRSGGCGSMNERGSYTIDDIFGMTIEIVCERLNDGKINSWEVQT